MGVARRETGAGVAAPRRVRRDQARVQDARPTRPTAANPPHPTHQEYRERDLNPHSQRPGDFKSHVS